MEYAHCDNCWSEREVERLPAECPVCGEPLVENDGAIDAGADWRADVKLMARND